MVAVGAWARFLSAKKAWANLVAASNPMVGSLLVSAVALDFTSFTHYKNSLTLGLELALPVLGAGG